MHDVIVIGGGPAGVTAALRARELGASVTLVERGRLGGTCTNDGCVPTRVLAKAARLLRDAEQLEAYGLMGERPTLDFAQLLARTQHTVYTLHEKKQLIGHLEQSGVTAIAVKPGDDFDPNLHEAVTHEDSDQVASEQIIGEVQRGYLLGERVLRPAMVRVAR